MSELNARTSNASPRLRLPADTAAHPGKLVFANQLRGLAALLVVFTHYVGIYFGAPQVVAAITFSPNIALPVPAWATILDIGFFRAGPFGVALFFLISGLVISYSLEKMRPLPFLVARFFRIFPTYLCCLGIGLTTVWLSAHYWHIAFGYGLFDIASNALLVNNFLRVASTDAVNWTLAIEIKFYLLLALGRPWFLRFPYRSIGAFALLVCGGTVAHALMQGEGAAALHATLLSAPLAALPAPPPVALTAWGAALTALLIDLNYLVFMLVGVLFFRHLSGRLGLGRLTAGSLPLLLLFCYAWRIGPQREQYFIVTANYLLAYLAFLACCIGRRAFRPFALLDFFADISFPLYVAHTLLGYTLLKLVMHAGVPYGIAMPAVFAVVVLTARTVHLQVELPSNAFGKQLAKRFAGGSLARPDVALAEQR